MIAADIATGIRKDPLLNSEQICWLINVMNAQLDYDRKIEDVPWSAGANHVPTKFTSHNLDTPPFSIRNAVHVMDGKCDRLLVMNQSLPEWNRCKSG